MAVSFKIPTSPKRQVIEISNFLGVDLTNTGSNIAENRSPNAPNIIRDVPGKVRKRMGYKTMHKFDEGGVVYGVHVVKTTTQTSLYRRNVCSARTLKYDELKSGESVYIYSNDCCLPVGSTVHVQFKYKTTGALSFSPYYESLETTLLNSINSESEFSNNYKIKEATNCFVITNTTSSKVNISLEDIMVYFIEEPEGFALNYISYGEINETNLYNLGTDHSVAPQSGTLNNTTPVCELSVNPDNVTGLVMLSFKLDITPSAGTLTKVTVTFKGDREGTEIVLPACSLYKSYSASGYLITKVIDTAINHTDYSLSNSKLTKIVVAVESTVSTFTATVNVSDIKITEVTLKEDFDSKDYTRLVHISNKMYLETNGNYSLLSEKMNSSRSKSWQQENKLYIIDGANYYVYNHDDKTFLSVTEILPTTYDNSQNIAYVPTVTIAKSPSGGGVSYDDLNLLTPAFIELFEGDEASVNYQLSFNNLSSTQVKVWVLNSAGSWTEKTENTDFTVNRTDGLITFTSAPGKSPVTGEDNIKVLAYKDNEGYQDRIKGCTIGALFGVNGAADRLFLSGNPNYLNVDWHSGQYQFNYFPDTSYAKLGNDTSAIVGYSIVNNYLATHKDENDTKQAVIIREGDLITTSETSTVASGSGAENTIYNQEPAFKIINTLQGNGAIAPNSFATLQSEPVFLTRSGIQAITPQDITGEKYSQNRSFYLNGKLLEESGLENAVALVHNDMYMLFINSNVYVLDGLQAVRTDKSEPYSSRQFCAFFLNNIPANIAWVENNEMWFGTTDGRLCKVYSDKESLESYNDDGQAINCWWETCDMDGALFYKNKTFRYMAVRLKSNIRTRVKMYSMTRGLWTLIKESKELSNNIFRFSTLTFSGLTFNNDTSDQVVSSKLRVKKIDKARFKLENSEYNEPFGIQNLAFEYVESGNFKG